jgi:hypothetical protein
MIPGDRVLTVLVGRAQIEEKADWATDDADGTDQNGSDPC